MKIAGESFYDLLVDDKDEKIKSVKDFFLPPHHCKLQSGKYFTMNLRVVLEHEFKSSILQSIQESFYFNYMQKGIGLGL